MLYRNISLVRILQLILFTAMILYFGRILFVPMCYGLLIAIVLYPGCKWLERHGWYPLGVIGVFSLVQYLEANVIFPKVVATQLKVSTWATLVGIITGGILWGVSGMILFIPFIGILKIIFDYVPQGKIFNILLARENN